MNEEMTGTGQPEQTTTSVNNESENTMDSDTGMNQPVEKMYSKSQVVELMKKRVQRSHNSFFNRYGVKDLKGLDELFNNAKSFGQMKDEYGAIQLKNSDLLRENAFLRNNINPDKYNDIVAYFKGNDIAFSEEALIQNLATHPEWLKPSNVPPTTTIKSLGAESHVQSVPDDASRASKLLGVKL